MMSTLGAMESNEATQKLTAVLNAYKLEAQDAIGVVDKLVNADLIAATSTEELATAFQYSASFANVAGVSIDKMIGLLTTASETTRLSGETVGQAFKSIFSRIQNVRAGKDIDDEGESINDSEKVLARYNITLRESATEFRNVEDILDEVGKRWKEFDTVEKAQIATAISGVHQRNTFMAVMENYDKVLKYTNETMEASGTSTQKYEHYLDSLQSKINELQVQWEQYIQGLEASGVFEVVINVLSSLLSVLDALTVKTPILQTVLGTFLAFKTIKGLSSIILNLGKSFKSLMAFMSKPAMELKQAFTELKGTSKMLNTITLQNGQSLGLYEKQQIATIISSKSLNMEQKEQRLTAMNLNAAQTQLILRTDEQTAANIRSVISNNNLTVSQKQGRIASILLSVAKKNGIALDKQQAISTAGLITKQKGATYTTQGLTAAMSALNIVLAAVSLAVSIGVSIWNSYQQAQEKAREAALEAANGYQETKNSMKEVTEEYKKLKKELASTADFSKQMEIKEDILALRDTIINTYGVEAAQIDLVNGKLDEQLKKLQDISKEKAEDYLDFETGELDEAIKWANKERSMQGTYFSILQSSYATTEEMQKAMEQRQILKDITSLLGLEKPSDFSMSATYHISSDGMNAYEYVEKLEKYLSIVVEKLDTNLTKQERIAYEIVKTDLEKERNKIKNDEKYSQYQSIITASTEAIFASQDDFTSEVNGKTELVNPDAILQEYEAVLQGMQMLSNTADSTIVNPLTGMEMNYEQLYAEEEKLSKFFTEFIDSIDNPEYKQLVQDKVDSLFGDFDVAAKSTIARADIQAIIGDSGITEELKKYYGAEIQSIFDGIYISTETKAIKDVGIKIQEALNAKGIVMTTEEIVDVLELLGYTYKKVETQTSGELIGNFAKNEDILNSTIENIEKLNNVISQVSLGGAIDLEQIQELKQAGIDVTQLINSGISDIDALNKIKQDYLDYQISLIDDEIEYNNDFLKTSTNITEEEIAQIKLENRLNELRKEQLKQAAKGMKTTASEYVESLKSANEIQMEIARFGTSRIDNETLDSISKQYEGMSSYVEKYRLGLMDNEELLSQFEKFYNEELDNYEEYQRDKYAETDEFYDKWLSDNKEWVEDFKNKYGVDLTEFENYNEAKLAIEAEYTKKRADLSSLFGEDYSDVLEGGYVNLGTGELTVAGKEATSTGVSDAESARLAQKIYRFQNDYKEISPKIKEVETNEENAKNSLEKMFDASSNSFIVDNTKQLNSTIDKFVEDMSTAYSLLQEINENNGKLTLDNLDAMKDAYPAMTEYVNQYLAGQIDAAEVISQFKTLYEQDKDKYIKALKAKIFSDTDFYNKVIKSNAKWVNKLRERYGIDLQNYTDLLIAKQTLIDNFNRANAEDVSKYIDLTSGLPTEEWDAYIKHRTEFTKMAGEQALIDLMKLLQNGYQTTIDTIDEEADDIEAIWEKLMLNTEDKVKDAMSNISSYLSNQKDIYDQLADGIVSAAQLEIDALDKEIELIEKKNEEQQRQIELQEKLEALNRAKTQRNVREYNAETGEFEWVANRKDIETAQREYDEALKEEETRKLEDRKAELEAYQYSFSNVEEYINNQRASDMAKKYIADLYYSGDTSKVDLLKLTDKQQNEFRTAYANAISQSLDFEQMQSNKDNNDLMNKIVSAGFGTKNGEMLNLNFEAIANALGVPLINTTGNYEDILKQTAFAETKPITSTINNITNTGAVTTSYVFSGDMTFKFDGDIDVDRFITELSTKLDEKTAITPIR